MCDCRCSVAPWQDSEEYEAWLDYLSNGVTTKEFYMEDSKKDFTSFSKRDTIKSFKIERSVGASAKNYPVRMPESRQHVKFAEGQTIQGKVFAGKGTKVEIQDKYDLESIYDVPANKIQKISRGRHCC